MGRERYYPSYLDEGERLREHMRLDEMVEGIAKKRTGVFSEYARANGRTKGNNGCVVLDKMKVFLKNEEEAIREEHSRKWFYEASYRRTLRKDDLFYTFFQIRPYTQHTRLEDGSWVEIKTNGFSFFGSLWLFENDVFYVITDQPVPPGRARIREADALQLILMQEQAFNVLLNGSTMHSNKLRRIICDSAAMPESLNSVKFYNIDLNSSQKLAVRKALSLTDDNMFCLVHGPPGTGKTSVITEVVRQLADQGKRILITSHTNVAVDNIMENLFPYLRTQMVRLGPRTKVSRTLRELVPTSGDELIHLRTARIVGATLSKASILVMTDKLSWSTPFFDTVIVDESSMATIPLTLVGILLGKTFALVGDHFQLPPITKTKLPSDCESLFQLLTERYREKSTFLNIQYRSHPSIVEFSSEYFYKKRAGTRIDTYGPCKDRKVPVRKLHNERVPGTINEQPLICINTHGIGSNSPSGWFPQVAPNSRKPSYFNEYEAAVAIAIRHDLMRAGLTSDQICIITPFRLQRQIVKEAIKGIYGSVQDEVVSLQDLTAATVDSIQGKERDVIIYCVTWAPQTKRASENIHILLRDWRRLNVALTRARKKLIIVGSISKLHQYPYSPLYGFLREKNVIISAPKIKEDDDFLAVLTHYYQKKTLQQRIEMTPHVKQAIKRIHEEIGGPAKVVSAQPPELPEHARIPEREFPKQSSVAREQLKPQPEYVPIITFRDWQEYGRVCRYHQDHPDADVREISRHTGVWPLSRVATFLRKIKSESKQTLIRETSEQKTTNKQVYQCLEKDIEKKYPKKGNLQLFRYKNKLSFLCDKCKKEVHDTLRAEWSTKEGKKVACNGCYGYLLGHSQKQTTPNKPKAKKKQPRKNDIFDSPAARARHAGLLGKDRTY